MARLNLETREGRVLSFGVAAVVLIVGWFALQGPWEAYGRSSKQLTAAKRNLSKAQLYHADVVAARDNARRFAEMTQGNFDLSSYLNGIILEMKLYERGAEVQTFQRGARSEALAAVQLDLKGVNVQELVDILHQVHSSGKVALHSVNYIKQGLHDKGLDCSIIFLSPRA
ncbi:MAG: hypothetical protein GY851_05595 [bacterium]|nr:hypothetical protein [bacterium]